VITLHKGLVTSDERRAKVGHGATVWVTGLSGSGKSTLATMLEERLLACGRPAYVLDGDNLRHGLNCDLGFDPASRSENVRRAAQVARLFADAGMVALVSLISPYAADRRLARLVHEDVGIPFVEVFVDTALEECERRDPKGLYARARARELRNFTGIDAPYERPQTPDVVIRTAELSLSDAVEMILDALAARAT
jgi:bifunctional enzyme CysN/CysC